MADRLTSELTTATIRLVRLPTRAGLAAAHDDDPDAFRELVYISLHRAPGEAALGWGECSALNAPTYTSEWAQGAYDLMAVGELINRGKHPMAVAAIEMAVLDAELVEQDRSLAQQLGTAGQSATAGAVVGLAPIPTMVDQVRGLVEAGYERIKCKIAPGRVVEPIRVLRSEFPDLEIQADANGSLALSDLGLLLTLRDLGVVAVEQPFPVGDHRTAARLVAESDLVVIADEAATTTDELWAVARDQAATAVAVKPPRVGGLRNALAMLDAATEAGLQCSIGGMLESGLGRHQLAALAPLAPFTVTGDLSPAGRWLAVDPFDDVHMTGGTVRAPDRPGIAGSPDLDVLDAHTVATATLPAAGLLGSLN